MLTKEGYTFLYWQNGEVAFDFNTVITEDITLTAKWEINKYTVTFKNWDGSILEQKEVVYGELPTYTLAEPTKIADKTYTYTFKCWDKDITPVKQNIEYVAEYDKTYIDYTVTFKFENGKDDLVKTYHYGDTVIIPDNPTKPSDDIYKYTFSNWQSVATGSEQNIVFVAKYNKEFVDYTVTFILGNGEKDVVKTYHFGETVEVPANPTKTQDDTYTYKFSGWDKQVITTVNGDATYTAQYDAIYREYTVTFILGNGQDDVVKTYHFGDKVEIPEEPTKAQDDTYTYAFAGWDKEITTVSGHTTYTAQYDVIFREYTVTFVLGNGEADVVKTYHFGDKVEVPADPKKAANETFTYSFAGWDKEVTTVSEDAVYKAIYDKAYVEYTVKFVLGNGEPDIIRTYRYNDTVIVPQDPSKEKTAEYTYKFDDWDSEITKVKSNATYTAVYTVTKNKYTVTFKNWDGTVLEEKPVEYGVVPTYTGETPVKVADETYTYEFKDWDKQLTAVEGNIEYTAEYMPTYIDYTVTFVLGNGEDDFVKTYHFGETVEIPEDPSKTQDDTYTYKFAGWDKEITTVNSNTTYTAQYDATFREYTVTFVLGNGKADVVKTYHFGDKVEIPEEPTKAQDDTYTYKFTGWDKQVTTVNGNTTYTAQYDAIFREYTVTFELGNGKEDIVKTYHFGDTVEIPTKPTKAQDDIYTYEFTGWDKQVTAVNGDATYTAQYDAIYREYTVTFELGNGQDDVVKTYHFGETVEVPEYPSKTQDDTYTYKFTGWDKQVTTVNGNTTYTAQYDAIYREYTVIFELGNGEADVVKTYHFGDKVEVPADPTKAQDDTYTYKFTGWDKQVTTVSGNTTYTAQYDAIYREYTVTFELGNGEADVVKTYHFGDKIEVPTDPKKAANETFTYTFAGWDKDIDTVSGDTVYKAKYTREYVEYTVTFVLGNGEPDIVATYHYYDPVVIPADPKKSETTEYTYTFAGWDSEVSERVKGDATYTAIYTATKNKYTVTFKNWDGTVLEEKPVEYGVVPTYTGTTPIKVADETYTYTFKNWDKQLIAVEGNIEYTAEYTPTYIEYTVTFILGNGEADVVKTYHFGETVEVPADPTKAQDDTYTYSFVDWDKEITTVSGNETYTAQYDAIYREYTVTFVLGNGEADVVKIYHFGDTVQEPSKPIKATDDTYTYAFAGWDKEITTVSGHTTYTAQYDAIYREYTVTFELGNGEADIVKTYHFGDKVEVPADPTKAQDDTYTYKFSGWDKEITTVSGHTTYTAQYDAIYREYTVTFVLGNGEADVVKTYHFGDTVEEPEDPTKAQDDTYTYSFADWDKEITTVSGHTTYTAVYTPTYIDYTVTFVLGNGQEDVVKTYHFGDKVEIPEDPTKDADDTYTYSFADWDKEITTVNGHTTYTAVYTPKYIDYTVTFVLGNGEDDVVKTYHFGDTVEEPEAPSKTQDDTYTYKFAGWDKQVTTVNGNTTYTAQYDATFREYTVTFVLGNGEADVVKTYHFGDKVEVPADPIKAQDDTYTYSFADWDKEITTVNGDETYTAIYTPTYIDYTVTFELGNGEADVVKTYHFGDTVVVPADPEKAATAEYTYKFAGWDKQVDIVKGNATYTAQYTATKNKYTVRIYDSNNNLLKTESVEYGTQLKDLVALTEDGTWVETYEGHELTDTITGNTDLVVVETAEIRQIDNILTTELAKVNNSNMTASFNDEEGLISVDFKNSNKSVSLMLDDVVGVLEMISNSDDSYQSIVLSYQNAKEIVDLKKLNYDELGFWDFVRQTESATDLARFIARVGKNSGSGSHSLGVTTTELATRTATTHITVTVTLEDGYVNADGSNTIVYDLIFTEP